MMNQRETKEVWQMETLRETPAIQMLPPSSSIRPARAMEVQMLLIRQEINGLREQLDAIMAQLAGNPAPLRLHTASALPARKKAPQAVYPPIKRIKVIHTDQGSQHVKAYGYDDREIEALCGPFEKVGGILLDIAGQKRWEEDFSDLHH